MKNFFPILSFLFLLPVSVYGEENPVLADVQVFCSNPLGDGSQIQDFLGAGGPLYYVAHEPNDPLVQAWNNIGLRYLTFETLHHEEPPDKWLQISRNEKGDIEIDFSQYDEYLGALIQNLGIEPYIYLGNIPRALSSHPNDPYYASYRPKDLKEWEYFVSEVVRHNVEKWNLRGIYYGAPGEPDHIESWKGSGGQDRLRMLREHIELYAATYRGVKSIDPEAKLGAPATMSWKLTELTQNEETGFILEDWIRELAEYNRSVDPENQVGLDYISWQDYGWASDEISEGADAVSAFLEQHGFDPATPKVLAGSGWGSWSSNYLDTNLTGHQRASHILHNVIKEFTNPGQRRFTLALYYTFFYRDDWRAPGQPEDDPYTYEVSLVRQTNDGSLTFSASYAAFQMLYALSKGTIVETQSSEPVQAMSVLRSEQQKIIVTLNNHTGDAVTVNVTIKDVPFKTDSFFRTYQRIDELNSVDGAGLEAGIQDPIFFSGQVSFPNTLLPYATIQVTIWPQNKE